MDQDWILKWLGVHVCIILLQLAVEIVCGARYASSMQRLKSVVSSVRVFFVSLFLIEAHSFLIQSKINHHHGCTARLANALSDKHQATMKHIKGISEIVDSYDTFIIDMWGVLHDGKKPYGDVLDTITKLRGKRLLILSNSSKRLDQSTKLLSKLGFDKDNFQTILTSGEWTHQRLNDPEFGGDPWLCRHLKDQPKTCFMLGSGDGDREYLESCSGWTVVDSIKDASLLLARGTFTIHETINKNDDGLEAYDTALLEILQAAAQRKVPMLVANPDFTRPDADRSPMPGSIGAMYKEVVAQTGETEDVDLVYSIGKPFPVVYDALLSGGRDRSRVCMVGDALETDVLGGHWYGIDTVWVTADGVHRCDVSSALTTLNDWNELSSNDMFRYSDGNIKCPTYQIDHFKW